MSKGGGIAKHTGILMVMELGIRAADALVAIILARYLAPQGFGLLAFALSFSWIFSILPGFGMGSLVTRNVARDPEHLARYLSNGLSAKLLLAILTLLLMKGASSVLGYSPEKSWFVLLAGLLMVCETNVRFTLSFFQAAQRMTTVAIVNLGVRAGWVFGSLIVVGLKGGINELLWVRVLVTAVGLIASVVLVNLRLQRIRWTFEPAFIWQMAKDAVPFALFRLYGKVYTDVDTVMLSTMRGDVMTGWYAAAYKVFRLFTFIPSSFFGATLPAMSRYSRDSRSDLVNTITQSSKYLAMIALPLFAGAFVVADQLILFLYGSAYDEAIPCLRILSWSVLLTYLNSVMTASIASVNKEWKGGFYLLMGAVFSSVSNLIVIPLFGHLGAASTTFMAEAFIFVLQLRLLKQTLPGLRLLPGMIKTFMAAGAMMAFAWFIRGTGLFVTIPSSALLYLGGLIVLRAVGRDEWNIFLGMIKRKSAKVAQEIPAVTPKDKTHSEITVHFRVKNEENFIRAAILSVLPLATRVMVYDTGSTDRTLDEIASIKNSKVELVRGKSMPPKDLTALRNEMIERTTTEWFMVVDGDEIYPAHAVQRLLEEMPRIPPTVHRLVVNRKHFVGSPNFISRLDGLGRIFRTNKIRWGIAMSEALGRVGHETPFFKDDPITPWRKFSTWLPRDIFFYHCQYLPRSSKDKELGRMRGWRTPPFPILPHLGPWPETLDVRDMPRSLTPKLVAECMALNAKYLWRQSTQSSKQIRALWKLKKWPPDNLVIPERIEGSIDPS